MKPLSKKAIYAATIRKFAKAMILIADELEADEAPKLPLVTRPLQRPTLRHDTTSFSEDRKGGTVNNLHLAIIAAPVISAVLFVYSYNPQDFAGFQQKISRRADFQAYEEKPLLPETIFKEVGK